MQDFDEFSCSAHGLVWIFFGLVLLRPLLHSILKVISVVENSGRKMRLRIRMFFCGQWVKEAQKETGVVWYLSYTASLYIQRGVAH